MFMCICDPRISLLSQNALTEVVLQKENVSLCEHLLSCSFLLRLAQFTSSLFIHTYTQNCKLYDNQQLCVTHNSELHFEDKEIFFQNFIDQDYSYLILSYDSSNM